MPSAPPAGGALAGRGHPPLPKIVNGAGLAPDAIAAQMASHLACLQHQAVATHVDPTTYARVRALLPGTKLQYNLPARCLVAKSEDGALQRLPGMVGLVAAARAAGATAATPGADATANASASASASAGGACDVALTRQLLQHLGAFVIVKEGLSSADAAGLLTAAPALQVGR